MDFKPGPATSGPSVESPLRRGKYEITDRQAWQSAGKFLLRWHGNRGHAALMSSEGEESSGPVEEEGEEARKSKSAGLTNEELEELHKTDPKRVKRILANRSSAARSKVRKLRYISELDSKSAALQQQMTELTTEMRTLQENTVRLSSENEWLFSQVLGLQEHSNRLEEETRALEASLRQLGSNQQAPQPLQQQGLIPESAFSVLQDQGQPSLQFPRRQISPSLPSRPSFAAVTSHFQGGGVPNPMPPDPHNPLYPDAQTPLYPDAQYSFGTEHPGAGLTTINSYQGSDASGSGLSSTTQELQLQPDTPALLSLLQNFDLGPRRASGPSGLPPYPSGLSQYARSSSLGVTPSRPLYPRPFGSQMRAIDPSRMLPPAHLAQLGVPDSRRGSLGGQGPLPGGYDRGVPEQPPTSAGQGLAGLARWPRHASEPPGGYQPQPPQWPPRPRQQ